MEGLVNSFNDNILQGTVECKNGIFTVSGNVHWGYKNNINLTYKAAEPADLRLSVKGSALPFPNEMCAFGTVNSGNVVLDERGSFSFMLYSPNSYYKNDDIAKGVGQGKILVEPMLYITASLQNNTQKIYEVDLGRSIPLRSLTNYPTKPVRSTGRNTTPYIY